MSIEKLYAYKYGELQVVAESLAKAVKENIRLDANGPYGFEKTWMFHQANSVLDLLEAQRKRGNE